MQCVDVDKLCYMFCLVGNILQNTYLNILVFLELVYLVNGLKIAVLKDYVDSKPQHQ